MCALTKVLLGEVNAGLSTTQVVVKELKASASVQDQMQFLEEVQPYRSVHQSIAVRLIIISINLIIACVTCIHTFSHAVSSTRTLQHPALLQCLAQCSEVTPYLLVMEFCPLVGHSLIICICHSLTPHYFLSWCSVVCRVQKLTLPNLLLILSGRSEELPPRLSSC